MLVLGAGSAGSRHAVNLMAAGARVAIADPDPERAAALRDAERVDFDLDRLETFDGIVVASPTVFHREQASAALTTSARVLVEKPLAADTRGLDELVEMGRDRLMVGYNLRLHEPIERLVALVHQGRAGRVHAVRLWFGSYLPDWRGHVDYRTTYSARADLGGGILLDAIHELDLLLWLLDGRFDVVGALVTRLGNLEIDVEDTVRALLRHTDGAAVEISLDYLSRRYRRGIEVIGERATIRFDWARQVLEVEDADGVEQERITTPLDRSYERQAERFLSFLRGEMPPPVDGSTAAASVRLAEQIRTKSR